jgi:hypothetical protein
MQIICQAIYVDAVEQPVSEMRQHATANAQHHRDYCQKQ